MSFTTAPRRRLAVLLVAVLTAALGGVVTRAAAGKPAATGNSPAAIRIDRVYSNVPAPIGLPEGAAPNVIVQTGDEFFVQVTLLDARGKPASFDAPTPLTLTATSKNTGAVLPSWGVTVAKGQQTAVITGSISVATNQVVVTVSGAGLSKVATFENWFDVLSTRVSRAAATEQGIGGNDFCTNATPDAPVCGTLLLPKLAESGVHVARCLRRHLRQVRQPPRWLDRAGARRPHRPEPEPQPRRDRPLHEDRAGDPDPQVRHVPL